MVPQDIIGLGETQNINDGIEVKIIIIFKYVNW